MVDEPKKADGQPEGDKKSPLEEQVSKMGEALDTMQKTNDAERKLLSDPDVRDLLARKAKGEKVTIETEGVEKEKTAEEKINELIFPKGEKPKDDSLEDLSNVELMEQMGELLKKALTPAVEEATKPLKDELEAMRGERETERKDKSARALADEVLAVAEKYKDFEDHKEGIVELYEKGPTIDDLYLLAKVKKVGLPSESPDSERPFSYLETDRRKAPEETRHGSRGFRDIIREATAKKR